MHKNINKDYWTIPPKSSVLGLIIALIIMVMIIIVCLLFAFKNTISFYRTPAQLKQQDYSSGYNFRIGGYVASTKTSIDGKCLFFIVTDKIKQIKVHYCGFVPSLFRKGQGVVIDGKFVQQKTGEYLFMADQLLTKHDERYHPPSSVLR